MTETWPPDPDAGTRRPSRQCREQRIDAQQSDPGRADDTVWIATGSTARTYHEDRDCYALQCAKNDPVSLTRAAAQDRWRTPCGRCGGGNDE